MSLPAVCHYRPSVRRVEELDLSYEAKQSGGVTGNAMVGPAGEVKLPEFTDLVMTLLKKHTRERCYSSAAYFTMALAENLSLPFCLLMTNAWISQILSWAFRGKTDKKTYHGSAA